MRFLVLFFPLIVLSFFASAQEKMVLNGLFSELHNSSLVLEQRISKDKWMFIDTLKTDEIGAFHREYQFSSNAEMRLRFFNISDDSEDQIIFISSPDIMTFTGCCQAYEVEGGAENTLLGLYKRIGEQEKDSLFQLSALMKQAIQFEQIDSLQTIEKAITKVSNTLQLKRDAFLLQHTHSVASAILLEEAVQMHYFTENSRQALFDRFSTIYFSLNNEVKATPAGEAAKRKIDAWSKGEIGSRLAPLQLNTLPGSSINLISLDQSKLTAIVFWSTFHTDSEQLLQALNRFTNIYDQDNFNLVTVLLDNNELSEEALNYLEEKRIEGIHLIDSKQFDAPLAYDLGVESIPQVVFLDTNKRVIGRDFTSLEAVKAFVERYLNREE